jgi:CHAT domain-containing protein/Tfp pilus assembly protein PilF
MTVLWALTGALLAVPIQENAGFQELYDQGKKAMEAKDLSSAEKAFHSGLDAAASAGDKKWIGRFAQSIGLILANQNDFAKAAGFLDRAQAAFLDASDRMSAAITLDTLGQLQSRIGRLEEAQKSLDLALSIFEAAGDAKRLAKIRSSLTDLYFRRSDFRAALQTGFRALDENEKIEDHRETAKVLESLGNTFRQMGQSENALSYYRRALAIREKFGIKQDLPFSYRAIGAALVDLGRHAEALELFKKSLELGKTNGVAREVVNSSIAIGSSERALGHLEQARQSYEEALALAGQRGFKREAADALYDLGNLWIESNDLERALESHQGALKTYEGLGDPRAVMRSLNRLGVVQEDRGDLKGAEQAHARAIGLFEKIGAGITDPVQYGTFRQTSVVLYPHYARVLVKLGREREALIVAERSRGVGLSRIVALNGLNFIDLLSPEDAKTWQDVTARLGRASNALRVLQEQPASKEGSLDEARALYVQTERELSNLRDRLFASTPKLRAAQYREPPAGDQLEALAKASPDTLFVQWMMVDSKSALVFALSARGLHAAPLDSGTRDLRAASSAWRLSLAAGIDNPNGEEPALARKLYQLVFARIEPLLASGGYSRLVLVPEGPLLEVPFPALMDNDGKRLIDRYAISNTVSFSYLLEQATRPRPSRSLLSVADPIAPGGHRLVIPSGDVYGPLREALHEVKTSAGMYPDSLILAGPAARESEVKRRLPEFNILHFATHGILDRAGGLHSGLLLATEAPDSAEDGLLEAWEIAGMSLSARLAVLSACETARGKEQLGDGLLGLAWAFQAAGVPRVIASLWNVDDAATGALITSFYKELTDGTRVDDAMRSAIMKMRKDPRYLSPYYWSAFEVLGQAGALR